LRHANPVLAFMMFTEGLLTGLDDRNNDVGWWDDKKVHERGLNACLVALQGMEAAYDLDAHLWKNM
jgi:hypothetical protein